MKLLSSFSKLSRTKKITYCAIPAVLIICLVCTYICIPSIIRHTIDKKISKLEQEKNITITHSPIQVTQFSILGKVELEFDSLTLKSNNAKETFAQIESLSTKIRVWKGFHKCKDIQQLKSNQIRLYFVKNGAYNNYGFLQSTKNKSEKSQRDYQSKVNQLITLLGEICPEKLQINTLTADFNIDSLETSYQLSFFNILKKQLKSDLTIATKDGSIHWTINGNIDNKKKIYDGALTLNEKDAAVGALAIPFPIESLNAQCHQIKGNLTVDGDKGNYTQLHVSATINQFTCEHKYLADQPVLIDSIGAELNLVVYKEQIEIDSSSTLILNETDMHPYFRYKNRKSKHITLKINEKDKDAARLFRSLPTELFQVIPKLEVAGEINYGLYLDCDFGNLDSLKFDFNIGSPKHNFRIISGAENITKFNEPFEYVFYENGDTARVVSLSPENPYHCTFSQIPSDLTQSILAAEDGAFFQHRGFLKSPIQSALISDIKAKRFVRGGSTISMQLIKNLFLNRKKQFSRKFEELLLVWMIEDHRMITKERMFEIYVNIVEWGPRIIGIGEASAFYFDKKPSELTLPECVYLASLIRAPKHYAYTIGENGIITEAKQQEISAVAQRMLDRGFITEQQFNDFNPIVVTKQIQTTTEVTATKE